MSRTLALAAVLVPVLLLAACGDEGAPAPRARRRGPREVTGAGPPSRRPSRRPRDRPRGPEGLRGRPGPAPGPLRDVQLRQRAEAEGLFEGLPLADPEEVRSLLEALIEAKVEAEHRPGRLVGGAAGASYEPSREELRAAELGERLKAAVLAAPVEQARQAWADLGLGDAPVEAPTFVTVTAKVFGTGYLDTVEMRTGEIARP